MFWAFEFLVSASKFISSQVTFSIEKNLMLVRAEPVALEILKKLKGFKKIKRINSRNSSSSNRNSSKIEKKESKLIPLFNIQLDIRYIFLFQVLYIYNEK